ncbi:hypothetical protein M8J77_013259 [Diaphorina citri]|nr:hypothetical protein M8J77_013259 [Diaphorina citri]
MNLARLTDGVMLVSTYLLALFVDQIYGAPSTISEATLRSYLQPNDILSGRYDGLTTAQAEKRKLCTRPCDNATSMICYYEFFLENYNTIGPACGSCSQVPDSPQCNNSQCVTADGVERAMLTINRQLPGPSIQVCPGDLIVVDLHNKFFDRAVTIHWHGLYQRTTPFMDGVPGVTQCPILPATSFRYKFPATPFGTFFYHSHQGLQKMDGIVGSLVIRRPRSQDPLTRLYDFDLPSHVILLTDWLHTTTDTRLPGNRFANTGSLPDTILANGRTQYFYPNGTGTLTPYSVFKVTRGKRYRFRIIGASCSICPLLIAFEKHRLLFIASDGTPVNPVTVDSITILPGERFDVVVHANQPLGSYWIQMRGLGLCATKAATYAVLQYDRGVGKTSTSALPAATAIQRAVTLNPIDISSCTAATDLCFSRLTALVPPPVATLLKPKPDIRIPLAVDFYSYTLSQLFQTNTYHRWLQVFPNTASAALINNKSYVQTPFSLLTQDKSLPHDLVCTNSTSCGKSLPQTICECTHIIQVPLNAIAELIFIDYTQGNTLLPHPLHLHGTDMYILKQGKIPPNVDKGQFLSQLIRQLDQEGPRLRTTQPRPIVKDTVGNLPSGYTVVRVHFNNPGMWYFHCHFVMHTDTGMTLVFQVGDRKQFVRAPPHFPRCDNFQPAVTKQDWAAAKNLEKTAAKRVRKVPAVHVVKKTAVHNLKKPKADSKKKQGANNKKNHTSQGKNTDHKKKPSANNAKKDLKKPA